MSRTPAQIALLERIADQIESEPQLWDQKHFTQWKDCGTSHCIAGWAMAFAPEVHSWEEMLGFDYDECEFVFFNGFDHPHYEWSHKEVAEWLRGIARGDDVIETAPEWWTTN